jgi:uridine kinase
MSDETDSDKNVVSLDEFRLKHNTNPMEDYAPIDFSDLLSGDFDGMLEQLKGLLGEIQEDELPTYSDWISLSAVLAVMSDTLDHVFANRATQYETSLYEGATHLRNYTTAMQEFIKPHTTFTEEE